MRVPVSWLREHVEAPTDPVALERALVRVGLEPERVTDLRATVSGPLVIGRVAGIEQVTGVKKPIRYCQVEVGEPAPRGIVCGATNFAVGDLVVVALPGTVLPGGFEIAARKTYGRVSDGMICSARELDVGEDHTGIVVLPGGAGVPGADARPAVGLDDVLVELDTKPLRGHGFSVRGVARELSHSLAVGFRDPAVPDVPPPQATAEPPYPVVVEDRAGCDRFATRLVRGVDPTAASPRWLTARLAAAGIRAISLPVDVTNYVMLELGQPMHAWDADLLEGPLVVRRARSGERMVTLDGVDRALDPADLVIGDDRGPASLAAVMGGQRVEVGPRTTSVLFEAAHWDAATVGRTARRHRLPSEAAKRWERGVDPQLPPVALQRAVDLLVTYAGGQVDPRVGDLDYHAAPTPVTMAVDTPGRIAGVPYPAARVIGLLEAIGCAVTAVDGTLTVTPPSWRSDLVEPADLAEEVARIDGYDQIPSRLPDAPPGSGLTATQRRRRSVSRALAEQGFVETLCYPFVGDAVWEAFGLPAEDARRRAVRVANPISDQEPFLRTTLLPPLLAALRRNLGRGARDAALYEVGLVFHPAPGEGGAPPALPVTARPDDAQLAAAEKLVPEQPWHVAAVLTGDAWPAGWWGAGRPADWSDAVQAARTVLAAAGLGDDQVTVRAAAQPPWHPGRCAAVRAGDVVVGYAGELHPAVCDVMELPRRTCAMELTLDALPLPAVAPAPRISGYPPALIDVAMLVDAQVPAAEVEAALVAGAGELLESVRLFDVYTGERLGVGRKSLAYKLTFRAADRTLTVEEAVAARDAAVAEVAGRFGAQLRGA